MGSDEVLMDLGAGLRTAWVETSRSSVPRGSVGGYLSRRVLAASAIIAQSVSVKLARGFQCPPTALWHRLADICRVR